MSQLTIWAELRKTPTQRTLSKNKGCTSKQQNLILHPPSISSLLDLLLRCVLLVVVNQCTITWSTLCRAPLFDGLHIQFLLLLLLYYLSRHHLQDEAATIPCWRTHLEYQEHHVHPVGQEYRDGQGHCCHCEQRLEQDVHDLPVPVTQQSAQPPPDVVRFLCFLWELPEKQFIR